MLSMPAEISSVANSFCHFFQRLQLPVVNKAELPDEVVKVLVAGVDMSLSTHVDDAVKVVDVDMDKDTEEASEDLSANLLELLREGNTYSGGEDVLVVNEHLNPVHQHTHVLRG